MRRFEEKAQVSTVTIHPPIDLRRKFHWKITPAMFMVFWRSKNCSHFNIFQPQKTLALGNGCCFFVGLRDLHEMYTSRNPNQWLKNHFRMAFKISILWIRKTSAFITGKPPVLWQWICSNIYNINLVGPNAAEALHLGNPRRVRSSEHELTIVGGFSPTQLKNMRTVKLDHLPTNRGCKFQKYLSCHLHPGRLTWNLQITHLERKMIFQTSMLMLHVNLQGCSNWFLSKPADWLLHNGWWKWRNQGPG